MTDDPNKLSVGGAWAMGTVFVLAGVFPILIGLGLISVPNPGDTPKWVGLAAGLMFVFAGLAIILDYGIAAVMGDAIGPDGDFPNGTPFAIRLGNFILGTAIVGLMLSVFGWVAFGRGERHFSTTISLPFMGWHGDSGEMTGRIVFGAFTVLIGVMFVACGWIGLKRLVAARR